MLPLLPDPKDIYSIVDGQHCEPILPIPKDIRPTLAKYRYSLKMCLKNLLRYGRRKFVKISYFNTNY